VSDAEEKGPERDGPQKQKGFWSDLPTLLGAVAVALAIRTFLVQPFYVPSDSMLPTLLVGDHVFVNKFLFGAGLTGTGVRLPGVAEPERGDVVVFQFARAPGGAGIFPADQRPELPRDAFVKRLIGLPGDRVAVVDGRLVINGDVVPLEPTGQVFRDGSGRAFDVYIERLNGCPHWVLDDPNWPSDDMAAITIQPGRYFFMGDNRDNSYDGRRAGTVRLEELAGPARLLYWSWDWNGSWLSLLNPLTWWDNLTAKMRWGRMGSFRACIEPGERLD
jgi:signal peptidase I